MSGLDEDSPGERVPTGIRAERSRQAIVTAARKAFLRDGYEVSMDVLAAEAGVSKVTVYNHFRNKESLFTAVIGDALNEALSETLSEAQSRLADTGDVRAALVATARAWVARVSAPSVLALRNLVTGELRRFPELGQAWQQSGPGRFFPLLSDLLRQLSERKELAVPDVEVAVVQLFSLTLYPHLVYNSYGSLIDDVLADKLITAGVDMFLNHYRPPDRSGDGSENRVAAAGLGGHKP